MRWLNKSTSGCQPFQVDLFHQVGQERQHTQVACAFHGSSHPALVFQAIACDTAREQFALLVDELEQEVCVLIIDVFDAELAETAVFFVFQPDFRVAQKLYVFS